MNMKKTFIRPIVLLMLAVLILIFAGCSPGGIGGADNYPYEPDTPAPDAHEGVFSSDHGTMTFSGDGESIVLNIDDELAGLTGLPGGEHEGTYVFLSGDLPPHGSFPVRYDIAHEMMITVGESSAVIDMGTATPDGKSATFGVNTVTPEKIPMLFKNEDGFFTIEFNKTK